MLHLCYCVNNSLHLNLYEQDKFHAYLSTKKFYLIFPVSTNTTKNSTKTDNCQDVLTDCDVANMTSGICGLPTYARKMCAEYCNMCSIGRFQNQNIFT